MKYSQTSASTQKQATVSISANIANVTIRDNEGKVLSVNAYRFDNMLELDSHITNELNK